MNKLYSLILFLAFVGCKGDPIDPIDFGYNYFPISIGSEWNYIVDSTFYDEFNGGEATTKTVQIHELVTDTFSDLAGNLNYFLERRTYQDGSLISTASYSVYILNNQVIRVRDNQRIVILTFPVIEGNSWDGYAYSSRNEDDFLYLDVSEQTSFNGLELDSTVRVLHYEDTTNFIFKKYQEERYARNLGMYYSEYLLKETQQGIDSGVYVIQKLVE